MVEYEWMGILGCMLDLIFPKIVQISFQYENEPSWIKASAVVILDGHPNGFIAEVGMDPNELSRSTHYKVNTVYLVANLYSSFFQKQQREVATGKAMHLFAYKNS